MSNVYARLRNKSDTYENWNRVPPSTFVPLKGELIIYLADDYTGTVHGKTIDTSKDSFKIGTGTTYLEDLEFFVSDAELDIPYGDEEEMNAIESPVEGDMFLLETEESGSEEWVDVTEYIQYSGYSSTTGVNKCLVNKTRCYMEFILTPYSAESFYNEYSSTMQDSSNSTVNYLFSKNWQVLSAQCMENGPYFCSGVTASGYTISGGTWLSTSASEQTDKVVGVLIALI